MMVVKAVFHFFQSFFQLNFSTIFNKKIDVLFYYPKHFNLNNKDVRHLQLMVNLCIEKKLNYLLIEEPDFNSDVPRNINAIKFDFYFFIISILRKFYFKITCVYTKDRKIGKKISFMFKGKENVKNIITLSQSMQSFFSVVYPNANLFDYQHGVISNIYEGYMVNDKIASSILLNRVKLLLHGSEVKSKLTKSIGGDYFFNNSYVVGAPFTEYKKKNNCFNGNILYSLQFSSSHTLKQNQILYEKSISFFEDLKQKNLDIKIYLKHHPRFNNCINIDAFYDFSFIYNSHKDIDACFDLCSLHITEYSTMVLDGITYGVPSLFTNFCDSFNLFNQEYKFPHADLNIIDGIIKLSDDNFYIEVYKNQLELTNKLYQPFDKNIFLKTILK